MLKTVRKRVGGIMFEIENERKKKVRERGYGKIK